MPQQTQAQAFIDVLTAMWRDDRASREEQRRFKLKAVVRRFVEEFRTEPVSPPPQAPSRHRQESAAEHSVAAE